jgi:flagellar biosynthesis/type III secretory pathway protein FliH
MEQDLKVEDQAKEIERLRSEIQKARDEGYREGYSHALYVIRNLLNEKFGL